MYGCKVSRKDGKYTDSDYPLDGEDQRTASANYLQLRHLVFSNIKLPAAEYGLGKRAYSGVVNLMSFHTLNKSWRVALIARYLWHPPWIHLLGDTSVEGAVKRKTTHTWRFRESPSVAAGSGVWSVPTSVSILRTARSLSSSAPFTAARNLRPSVSVTVTCANRGERYSHGMGANQQAGELSAFGEWHKV